jgi:tRNA(fMet)-specific endonuclease VapC
MPRFMLDTDTVSHALRGYGHAGMRIREMRPSAVCMSALTLAELRYGADKKKSRKLHRLIDAVVEAIEPIPFDFAASNAYGSLAADLESRGEPIRVFDSLIAAHALSLRMTLVTNNTKHFIRVSGLRVENWTG